MLFNFTHFGGKNLNNHLIFKKINFWFYIFGSALKVLLDGKIFLKKAETS